MIAGVKEAPMFCHTAEFLGMLKSLYNKLKGTTMKNMDSTYFFLKLLKNRSDFSKSEHRKDESSCKVARQVVISSRLSADEIVKGGRVS